MLTSKLAGLTDVDNIENLVPDSLNINNRKKLALLESLSLFPRLMPVLIDSVPRPLNKQFCLKERGANASVYGSEGV